MYDTAVIIEVFIGEVFYKNVALQITKWFLCIFGKNLWIIHVKEFVFNKVPGKSRLQRYWKNGLL